MKKIINLLLILLVLCGCGSKTVNSSEPLHTDSDPNNNKSTLKEQNEEQQKEEYVPLEPIIFEGSGDDVLEFEIPDNKFYYFHIEVDDGYVSVKVYDDNGNYDLLVSDVAPYSGNVFDKTLKRRTLVIESDSNWVIEIRDFMKEGRSANQNDTISGNGDDLFWVDSYGKTATIKATDGYLSVKSYNENGRYDLLVSDVAPYEGKVLISNSPLFFEVNSESDWEITFN